MGSTSLTFETAEAPLREYLSERFGKTIGFETANSLTIDARLMRLGVFTQVERKISGLVIVQAEREAIPGMLMTMLKADLMELRDELRRVADLIDMGLKDEL
jgi:hypothetical protein